MSVDCAAAPDRARLSPARAAALTALKEELVAARPALRAYFARRISPGEDAEDLVHEVYVRVLSAAMAGTEIGNVRALLMHTARTVLIDRARRGQVRHSQGHLALDAELADLPDGTAACPEATSASRQRLRAVTATLDQLDPICRRAFLLARVEGRAHREVAALLGLSPVEIGRLVQRALTVLVRSERGLAAA